MHKNIVTQIRKATRKKYSAEEKIRIVLEGLRGEIPISELCCREGIAPTMIYVSLGKSHIREQVEKLNSITVPKSACASSTYGTREHAYFPRASLMQRTHGV